MKNYYEILEIDKSATDSDIKKAYRKLAKEHHPDVNNGNNESGEIFKTINEAYSTLSDPLKREEYDRGLNSKSKSRGFSYSQWEANYKDSFRGGFGRSGFDDKDFSKRRSANDSLHISEKIDVSIIDLINGNKFDIVYNRTEVNDNMEWNHVKKTLKFKLNIKEKYVDIIKEQDSYSIVFKIHGMGDEEVQETFNIISGNVIKTTVRGDLNVKINITDLHGTRIEDHDVVQDIDIPLSKALFNDEKIEITTIFGKKYKASVNTPKYLNDIRIHIRGEGLMKKDGSIGNYIIKFNILCPNLSKLSEEDTKYLKSTIS